MDDALLDAVMEIEGFTSNAEIAALYEHASAARLGIVEIGAYCGRSTVALALGSKNSTDVPIFAIEPHEPFMADDGFRFEASARSTWMRTILHFGLAERVRLINLPSSAVVRTFPYACDLVFVDGDHRHSSVYTDTLEWSSSLRAGGYLLLHDADRPAVQGAIAQVLDEDTYRRLPDVGLLARFEKLPR